MKGIGKMTQAEVAAFVQSHLRKYKIYVTLSGGAAVSIYTVNRYVSADVDLVEDTYVDRNRIKIAMEAIGFREKNRYFIHSDTQHIVEFPSGPLSVGGEPILFPKERAKGWQAMNESPREISTRKKKRSGQAKRVYPAVSYRLPENVHDDIYSLAMDLDVPLGEVVSFLLRYGLDAYRKGRLSLKPQPLTVKMTLRRHLS